MEQTTTTRRAVIKGVTVATAAAALPALPAIAGEPHDAIFALIAECERLRALVDDIGARMTAIADSYGDKIAGGWLPIDIDLPEFQPMRAWTLLHHPDRRVPRHFIEDFNASTENAITDFRSINMQAEEGGGRRIVITESQINDADMNEEGRAELARRKAEGAARLAWWDQRQAEREHNAEISGYNALNEQREAVWDQYSDALDAVLNAEPATILGAMAQLRMAIDGIKETHTIDGEFHGGLDNYGVFNAYDALKRLLPGAAA